MKCIALYHLSFNYYVVDLFRTFVRTLTSLLEDAQKRQGLAIYQRRMRDVIIQRNSEQAQIRLLERSQTVADLSHYAVADGWKDR